MPRIRQYAAMYDETDFRKEIFRKMAERYDTISVRKLAAEAGVSQATLNQKLRHCAKNLDVYELRLIIPVLKPDPGVVLKLLGYTGKDITKFKNQKTEETT